MNAQRLCQILLSTATVLYLLPLNAMEMEGDPDESNMYDVPINVSARRAPTHKRPRDEVQNNTQEKPLKKKRKIGGESEPSLEIEIAEAPKVPQDSFVHFPDELRAYFIGFMNLKDPDIAFHATNKAYHTLMESKYAELNRSLRHVQWHGSDLTQRNLYFFNTRYRTLLGLYANIKKGIVYKEDRTRFERLCTIIQEAPFFESQHPSKTYANFLRLDLAVVRPTDFDVGFFDEQNRRALQQASAPLGSMLRTFAAQENPKTLQNETALYFHCACFASSFSEHAFKVLKKQPLYTQLTGSFMDVLNEELLTLKSTPGLSSGPEWDETWERIIDLDPGVTLRQLYEAVFSHLKSGHDSKVSKYIEKIGEIFGKEAKEVLAKYYWDIGTHYFDDRENSKALPYFMKGLEFFGEYPPAEFYDNIATAHYQEENFVKAAEYYEKELELLGERARAVEYTPLCESYFHAGNFLRAMECYEKVIEICNGDIDSIGVEIIYSFLTMCYMKLENGEDEKIIHYGEQWYEKEYEIPIPPEKVEEILQALRAAYTRMGNHERADFFGKVLEEFNQEDVEELSEEEGSDPEASQG